MQGNVQRTPESSWSDVRFGQTRFVGLSVALACLFLVAAELALQVRSQLRSGQSVFTAAKGETKYVMNAELGVRTLRPNTVIEGSRQVIATNRYGLRGDDFEPKPPPGEFRIAQLGASTIQGAFAPTNAETSSAVLARLLANALPSATVRVINAGLDGMTLDGQTKVLEKLLPQLGVRFVIWYPGTNDIGCTAAARPAAAARLRLPWFSLPRWTLSNDLIVMNTTWLRRSNAPFNQSLVRSFDLEGMRKTVERGIDVAGSLGMTLVLVTSATGYRSEMTADEIAGRASTALFFRPCYTGPELAASVDAFNEMLREVASERAVPLIDAARLVPADPSLFGDASHFSASGEARYAAAIATELTARRLPTGADSP
jgi:lysophospholipase L1-like esterase